MAPVEFTNVFRPNFTSILIRPLADTDIQFDIKITSDIPGTLYQPGIVLANDDFGDDFTNEVYKSIASYFAQEYKERIIDNIETQEFKSRWEQLNDQYLQWKRRAELDERTWIRSGQLLDAIRVRWHPNVGVYSVGIDASERYREVETVKDRQGNIIGHTLGQRTDKKILTVCRFLEWGTTNMPARKLWKPTKDRMFRDAGNIYGRWKSAEGAKFLD